MLPNNTPTAMSQLFPALSLDKNKILFAREYLSATKVI